MAPTIAPLETWRPVIGFEGFYEVSDIGRVRSVVRTVRARGGMLSVLKGRLLKVPIHNTWGRRSYRVAGLCRNGRKTNVLVHRLVLEAFVGPPAPGQLGRHLDDDSLNNCVENLAWGSLQDNADDRKRNGGYRYTGRPKKSRKKVG